MGSGVTAKSHHKEEKKKQEQIYKRESEGWFQQRQWHYDKGVEAYCQSRDIAYAIPDEGMRTMAKVCFSLAIEYFEGEKPSVEMSVVLLELLELYRVNYSLYGPDIKQKLMVSIYHFEMMRFYEDLLGTHVGG